MGPTLRALLLLAALLVPGLPDVASAQGVDPFEAHERGDYATAFAGFKALAEDGDRVAQFALAVMYEAGKGIPRDLKQAIRWYQTAAANGQRDAMFNLGAMYANGEGVQQDLVTALAYLDVADLLGHKEAPELRETVAEYMSEQQLAEANERVALYIQANTRQAALAPERRAPPPPPPPPKPAVETPPEEQTLAERLIDHRNDPIAGNLNGDVTIVMFFDYRCLTCKQISKALIRTVQKDGKVRLVFKETPLLGPHSRFAAEAALAANEQGQYLKLHIALIQTQSPLNKEFVLKTAKKLGFDMDRLRRDLESEEFDALIKRNHRLAKALNLRSTLSFVIGDRKVVGIPDMVTVRELIAETRVNKLAAN